jgi:exosortase H (IPTLxxWG-CTERM-specific)
MRRFPASADTGQREPGAEPLFSFAIRAIPLLALAVLTPEAVFDPLNRHTAAMTGRCLEALGCPAMVDGITLSRDGFSVRVVCECTALYMAILFLCFTLSRRAGWTVRLSGLALGIPVLHAANIMRIAAVFAGGVAFPQAFEAIHAFAGQAVSVLIVVVVCMIWSHGLEDSPERLYPGTFLLRFSAASAVAFLVWLPLNTAYVALGDRAVSALFSLFDYTLIVPRRHDINFQTFSIVTLFGLVYAVRTATLRRRLTVLAAGCAALFTLQILFRICNALITAFDNQAAIAASKGALIAAQYLVPFLALLALRYERKDRTGPVP